MDPRAPAARLHSVSAVGVRFPLRCTANGKALLAAMPEGRVRSLLEACLEHMTANTAISVPVATTRFAGDEADYTGGGRCRAGIADTASAYTVMASVRLSDR